MAYRRDHPYGHRDKAGGEQPNRAQRVISTTATGISSDWWAFGQGRLRATHDRRGIAHVVYTRHTTHDTRHNGLIRP